MNWKKKAQINKDVIFFKYFPIKNDNKTNEIYNETYDEIYVWDVDKTYLDTQWSSIIDIFKILLEKAFHKKNIPGTKILIHALQNSWKKNHINKNFPIFFITASPPQMEGIIKEKLQLDKINPLGCFFKDNLKNLKFKRLWRLTNQIGYKIQALLQLRLELPKDIKQILWGDDSESDAIIYNLYSDICSRRIDEKNLRHVLKQLKVIGDQSEIILNLQKDIPIQDPVDKIYINLASDTDPEYYLKFGRRTVPVYNTFQMAIDLYQDNRINKEQVIKVAFDLVNNFNFSFEELEYSFDESIRHHFIGKKCVDSILPILQEEGVLPYEFEPSLEPLKEVKIENEKGFFLEGVHEPWIPERIDYLHDYR